MEMGLFTIDLCLPGGLLLRGTAFNFLITLAE
jgi:hypothetical protein